MSAATPNNAVHDALFPMEAVLNTLVLRLDFLAEHFGAVDATMRADHLHMLISDALGDAQEARAHWDKVSDAAAGIVPA